MRRWKHWPFEAQMERWFPSPDGERNRFMTAERRGRHGRQCPDPTSPRRHPVVPGSRGSKQEVSTRGRLANAGADAGLHNRRRTGEVCLAIRPYGKKRSDIPRGEPALQWAPVEPGELGYGAEIGGLGIERQTPQIQVLRHPLAKCGHGGGPPRPRGRGLGLRGIAHPEVIVKDRGVAASAGKTGRSASRSRARHPAPRVPPLPRQRLRSTLILGRKPA